MSGWNRRDGGDTLRIMLKVFIEYQGDLLYSPE
jgi:hypothetical protein